jgi:hypothetical protein
MTLAGSDERLTTLRLMHALDDVQLFQFFKRAIDGDQSKCTIFFACYIKDFNRSKRARGVLNCFNDGAARSSETVSVFL